MSVVAIYYDQMNQNVTAQIVRDFLVLSNEFPGLQYLDPNGQVDKSLMQALHIELAPQSKPVNLYVVYKCGKEYPDVPENEIRKVYRDLSPDDVRTKITQNDPDKIGYYLKPQGRTGANLTERYLNRAYPKGRGVTDPLVLLMWG